jgi:hypothetical protein
VFTLDNATVPSWSKDSSAGSAAIHPKASKSDKNMFSKSYPWPILMALSLVTIALAFREEILIDNSSSQIANSSLKFSS